jgi:pilus assembly protein Flp/PilA
MAARGISGTAGGSKRGEEAEGSVAMRRLTNYAKEFLRTEDGPTAAEYAVMLSLIILASAAAITGLGSRMVAVFEYDYAHLPEVN